jgi:hypothetical protein
MTKQIETRIIGLLIDDAIAAGYTLGVWDGQETVLKHSTDKAVIFDKLFSVGEEHLLVYKDKKRVGAVFLVHGNGGDVVADYSSSLEPIMKRCNAAV